MRDGVINLAIMLELEDELYEYIMEAFFGSLPFTPFTATCMAWSGLTTMHRISDYRAYEALQASICLLSIV